MFKSSPEVAGCRYPDKAWPPNQMRYGIYLKGKLGNGEHLFLEAFKHKENNIHMIYIIIIM